jgi:hypothetical protein
LSTSASEDTLFREELAFAILTNGLRLEIGVRRNQRMVMFVIFITNFIIKLVNGKWENQWLVRNQWFGI